MNWKQLLEQQLEAAFKVAERLVRLLDEKDLAWKPADGSNWMTTGQLLLHMEKNLRRSHERVCYGRLGYASP